jgi:hypothetical protein
MYNSNDQMFVVHCKLEGKQTWNSGCTRVDYIAHVNALGTDQPKQLILPIDADT